MLESWDFDLFLKKKFIKIKNIAVSGKLNINKLITTLKLIIIAHLRS